MSTLRYRPTNIPDFSKKEYDKSESESDGEDDTSQSVSKVSDLRNRFLENVNFENKSNVSYSTQSSVSSSRLLNFEEKINASGSKTTIRTIKTQYSVSSHSSNSSTTARLQRQADIDSYTDQNSNTSYSKTTHKFTHRFQTPTAVLPILPQSSPKTPNKGAIPGSPKEFKPKKETPTSPRGGRSDIIAARKFSKGNKVEYETNAARKLSKNNNVEPPIEERSSQVLNNWNQKFMKPKTPQPKALDMFKSLESQVSW